jgi:hypothetical protein
LLHLIPVSPLELNLKSLASAHTSAIQPEMASCKCLDRLPIHAVMVLDTVTMPECLSVYRSQLNSRPWLAPLPHH